MLVAKNLSQSADYGQSDGLERHRGLFIYHLPDLYMILFLKTC